MRINVSNSSRICFLILLLLMIFVTVGSIALCRYFYTGDADDYFLFACVTIYDIIICWFLWYIRRLLTYVIKEDHLFHLYSFFHKKLCTVYEEKPIYYYVFRHRSFQFVVLSNEFFVFDDDPYNILKKRFIHRYDYKKQIVVPLNKKTANLFKFEEWRKADKL